MEALLSPAATLPEAQSNGIRASVAFPQKIEKLVRNVYRSVRKTMWTSLRITTDFGRRSAERIAQEGDVCYMNSCLDHSLVMLHNLMDDVHFRTQLVCEFGKNALHEDAAHFRLDCHSDKEKWSINPCGKNNVKIIQGKDTGLVNFYKEWEFVIDNQNFDPSCTPEQLAQGTSAESKFSYFLNTHVARLVASNTPETWERFLELINRRPEEPVIITNVR